MGFAVLLTEVTEFILVTGPILMTGARIETADQSVVHTTVMTVISTIPVETDTMMTGIMTSTMADIMTGVMTGGMTTEVDTGLHTGVLLPKVKDNHHHRTPPPDSRDHHHRDKHSKSPTKPEHSQSHCPECKE